MKTALRYAALPLLVIISLWPLVPVTTSFAQSRAPIGQALFFGGSGDLNDATSGGLYTALTNHRYVIRISSIGTPDQFEWAEDGGSPSSPVNITGNRNAQALADGVTIAFAATTGHTLSDVWVIYAAPVSSLSASTFISNLGWGGLLRPADQRAQDWISLKDYCVGDGTDCTAGFAAWIQAAKDRTASPLANGTSYGAKLLCPSGNYPLASTETIEGFIGLHMDASEGCQFQWTGNTSGPVLDIYGVGRSVFDGFSITISSSYPLTATGPTAAIRIRDGASGDASSQSNTFENIRILGNFQLNNGVFIDNDPAWGGVDGNNDFHTFRNVQVYNFLNAGYLLLGSQDFSEVFENCGATSGSTLITQGLYGVEMKRTWATHSGDFVGSYTWRGGGIQSAAWNHYIIGSSQAPTAIYDSDDETYGGMLYAIDGISSQISITGGRFSRESTPPFTSNPEIFHVTHWSFRVTGFSAGASESGTVADLLTDYYTTGGTTTARHWIANSGFANENFTAGQFFTGDPLSGGVSYTLDKAEWSGQLESLGSGIQPFSYATGTITATSGVATISGSGTAWTAAMATGYIQIVDTTTIIYKISSINVAAQTAVLTTPYAGTGGSGLSYKLGYGESVLITPNIFQTSPTGGQPLISYSSAPIPFIPVLSFGGGSKGITYARRNGEYYQIGHLTYVSITINLSSKGTSTGNAQISGFPACSADAAGVVNASSMNTAVSPVVAHRPENNGYADIHAFVAAGKDYLALADSITGGGVLLTDAVFNDTSEISLSFTCLN